MKHRFHRSSKVLGQSHFSIPAWYQRYSDFKFVRNFVVLQNCARSYTLHMYFTYTLHIYFTFWDFSTKLQAEYQNLDNTYASSVFYSTHDKIVSKFLHQTLLEKLVTCFNRQMISRCNYCLSKSVWSMFQPFSTPTKSIVAVSYTNVTHFGPFSEILNWLWDVAGMSILVILIMDWIPWELIPWTISHLAVKSSFGSVLQSLNRDVPSLLERSSGSGPDRCLNLW